MTSNIIYTSICSIPGEAMHQNSLLAADRPGKVDEGKVTRCCGQGCFAYILFPKKVGEKVVSLPLSSIE